MDALPIQYFLNLGAIPSITCEVVRRMIEAYFGIDSFGSVGCDGIIHILFVKVGIEQVQISFPRLMPASYGFFV